MKGVTPMEKCVVTIRSPQGLHARPAGRVAEAAAKYASLVTLRRLDGEKPVNAKSTLHLLTGRFSQNCQAELCCDGADETEALAALKTLIEGMTE